MGWTSVKEGLPDNSTKEPIFLRRKGQFEYGIIYKLRNEEGKWEWRIPPEVTDWMEPPE